MTFLYFMLILSICFESISSNILETREVDIEEMNGALPTILPDVEGNQINQHWPVAQKSGLDDAKFENHPHSLTRLIKTLSDGLNPLILKENYVEPVEKRRKPVTLVGLRKNGRFPRQHINLLGPTAGVSTEVAEMQSPFNDISFFWLNNPNYNS